MSNYMIWSIYLGSVYDNPERIKAIRQFVNGDVTLCEGCVFDCDHPMGQCESKST